MFFPMDYSGVDHWPSPPASTAKKVPIAGHYQLHRVTHGSSLFDDMRRFAYGRASVLRERYDARRAKRRMINFMSTPQPE